MKSLNNSSVDVGGVGAGVGSRPDVDSGLSVAARDPGVNVLDQLAALGVPLVGGVRGLVRR